MMAAWLAFLALLAGGAPNDPSCLVIAHRGASAYLPEHTLVSYALACGQGADYIEPDVVLTADGVAVCSHDITVSNERLMRERFPGRERSDGKWYFIDFTLDELRCLGQSLGRDGGRLPGLQVATLSECLSLVARLEETTGREIGVIPEPKQPEFHRAEGLPIEPVLVEVLRRHGYSDRGDRAIIQCFDLASLRQIRTELACDLPLVYLSGDPIRDETLDEVASFADGIGPSWELIETEEGRPGNDPELIARAKARGLAVYVYTFGEDLARQRRFMDRGVTGLFTDNPDLTVRVRNGENDR